ncbi:hypothetical protein [Candidatus Uabimicrobium amorphum]|uniref:Uncharacterized protein n=1 Tax=Uabimicrobium amorphum TaxID=2596890 RepID=A0A5S9IM87_UABAM|nr:hypothetical protein [Candidatus Uabimicrobium amorphum]BBM84026.1 hypothetical protein UABAM_02381 [Candidatus Uabimicrobium amorphum]
MNWKTIANQKCEQPFVKFWFRLADLPEKKIKWIANAEDLTRLFYEIDTNRNIDSEVLRFVAHYVYHQDMVIFQQNLPQILKNHNINTTSSMKELVNFMQDLSPQKIKNVAIQLQVKEDSEKAQPVNVEIQSQEDDFISFDLRQPDEEIDTLETCEFEIEKSSNLAQTLRNALSNTERYKKAAHSTRKWLQNGTQKSWRWLKKRKFFQPEISKISLWTWNKCKKGQNWLFYQQEIYVRIPKKKPFTGYAAILTHKRLKIKLAISKNRRKGLIDCNSGDFLRTIKGMLQSSKLETPQREILTQMKDSLLIRQKMLTQPETIFDIINYGEKTFAKILLSLSQITNKRKINRQIYQYLLLQVEPLLIEHHTDFRRELQKTAHLQGLKNLLKKYPLKRLSIIDKYKELRIIYKVKCITREYEKTPHKLVAILNLYLGTTGETNIRKVLPKILHTNDINLRVINALYGDRYLEDLLKTLKELQKQTQCKNIAQPLEQIINSFLSNKKFSFSEFKSSLNFVPGKLQSRITALVRRKLQEQLTVHVNNILVQEGRYIRRYNDLLAHLLLPQYEGANLVIYGVAPQNIAQRIKGITYQEKTIDRAIQHAFSELKIPKDLVILIKKAKSAQQLAQQKDLPNCIRILEKIHNMLQKQEPINLRKAIISLFKQHGNVNFSTSSKTITGYTIAHNLSRFFNDHTVEKLSIPDEINPTVYDRLNSIMEKSGRLQKL